MKQTKSIEGMGGVHLVKFLSYNSKESRAYHQYIIIIFVSEQRIFHSVINMHDITMYNSPWSMVTFMHSLVFLRSDQAFMIVNIVRADDVKYRIRIIMTRVLKGKIFHFVYRVAMLNFVACRLLGKLMLDRKRCQTHI